MRACPTPTYLVLGQAYPTGPRQKGTLSTKYLLA